MSEIKVVGVYDLSKDERLSDGEAFTLGGRSLNSIFREARQKIRGGFPASVIGERFEVTVKWLPPELEIDLRKLLSGEQRITDTGLLDVWELLPPEQGVGMALLGILFGSVPELVEGDMRRSLVVGDSHSLFEQLKSLVEEGQ